LASLIAVLSQGSRVELPALDTALGEVVLFGGVQGTERRVGWLDRTVLSDLCSASCGRMQGADRRVATGWSQPKRLLACAGNEDLLRLLLALECEEVDLCCLGASKLHTASIVATVVVSSVANVGKPLASESSLLAAFTSRSISSPNIAASNAPAAAMSAVMSILTLPNCISIMPLAVVVTLSSI
jgi:hypothetical protein